MCFALNSARTIWPFSSDRVRAAMSSSVLGNRRFLWADRPFVLVAIRFKRVHEIARLHLRPVKTGGPILSIPRREKSPYGYLAIAEPQAHQPTVPTAV